MVGGLAVKSSRIVLDVARQRGGAEPSTVTLHDHSRFDNDGAMTNVTWVQLPSGLWVMSFNGTNSKVDFSASLELFPNDGINDWSIDFWVYGDSAVEGSYREIVSHNHSAPGGFYIGHTNAVPAGMRLGGECFGGFTAYDMPFDAWHYMCFCKRTGVGATTFHVDGVQVATGSWVAGPDIPIFRIGIQYVGGEWWDGYVALLRAYTYALTPGQILQRFEATRRLFGV